MSPSHYVPVTQGEARSLQDAPSSALALGEWLDLFRWLSAFMVVFTHAANRFVMPLAEVAPAQRTAGTYVAGFMTGFSHQAVMVFFVLSGYLVGGALIKEIRRTGAVDVKTYLIKRFSRLWTVLLPALVFSLFCFLITVHVFHADETGFFTPINTASASLPVLMCNVFFLQTFACQQFAGNGPLWSLFNEFWYYILFLALAVSALSSRFIFTVLSWIGVALLLTVFSAYQFDGSSIGPYFSIWLMGVLAAAASKPVVKSSLVSALLLGVFLILMRLGIRREWWDLHPVGSFLVDVALGLLFCNLILSMRFTKLTRPPLTTWNTWLAGFSFSLYCIHVPILNLIGAARAYRMGLEKIALPLFGLNDWFYLLWPIGLSVAASIVFAKMTEQHTVLVKQMLQSFVFRETKA